ncbi:MAG: glycosyltransferase [Anaerolineae bacterium]
MLSKACIVGSYQRKLEELAKFPDVELTVIVPPYWRDERGVMPLEQGHTLGYQMIVAKMALNGHFHLHFYPGLGQHLRRLRPDILHIDEEPYNLATFQAMWLGRRIGARTLFFTWQNLHRRYPPPFRWTESYVLRQTDYAIAGSTEALRVLRTKGYQGPVKVIPQFGVDPEIYKELKELEENWPFTIGYVGRLVEEKGIHLLLRAVAKLEGDWKLHILGSGPFKGHLQELVQQLALEEQVVFDWPRPSEEMPTYYNKLDTLVLPSLTRPNWKEQFGRVLIEAMACGVPVVGSDCGEIPQVIGQAGLIFPEGDVAQLLAHLAELRDNPDLRRQLAERGRKRVLSHYSQVHVATQTYEVYRELVG